MANGTLDRKVDTSVKTGMNNDAVRSAINLYEKSRDVRRDQDTEDTWEILTDFYMNQFRVRKKDAGDFEVTSKLLHQAHSKIVKRYERPTRRFVSDNLDRVETEIVRDAVNTVQKRGGLKDILRSNWGADHKFILQGDAFIMLGKGTSEAKPVTYHNLNLTSVYTDVFATQMVSDGGENDVEEVFIIQDFSYDEAKDQAEINDWDRIFSNGRLPTNEDEFLRKNKTFQQKKEQEARITQIGHYYNIQSEEPVYIVVAGSSATVIAEFRGEDYPFFLRGEPFIPIVNLKFFPVPRGFYGQGLQLIYDLAIVDEKLRNLALMQVKDNVNPINVVNIQGESKTFLNQVFQARELRAMGEKGWVINEINNLGENTGAGKIDVLTTDPLTQEYERMQNDIVTELKRSGFPLDDLDIPASQLATNTVAQTASLNEFIREIQKQNEAAYRFLDLYTMAIMQDNLTVGSEATIITSVSIEGGELNEPETPEEDKLTMGDAVELIEDNDIDVILNLNEAAQIDRLLPIIQGTKAFPEFLAKRLRLEGFRIDEADLSPPGQEEQQGQVAGEPEPEGQLAQIQQLTA